MGLFDQGGDAAGGAEQPQDTSQLLERAAAAFDAGDYAAAEPLFAEAVRVLSDQPAHGPEEGAELTFQVIAVCMMLARAREHLGDDSGAQSAATTAESAVRDLVDVDRLDEIARRAPDLAREYLSIADFLAALAVKSMFARMDDESLDEPELEGYLGWTGNAVGAFVLAARGDPRPEVCTGLGRVLVRHALVALTVNRLDEALDHLDQAMGLMPDYEPQQWWFGTVREALDSIEAVQPGVLDRLAADSDLARFRRGEVTEPGRD
ncbi:hypothetical protein [Streptomonospora salina]|uniref:Tetratricopeptide (TPR) repeat protein n=1 Tax=Streptomonospora salina TaxID=104205 RepID=A0A841EF87_9ACTN|nr:hypothetical protein [Streptomonospora salina]MBB5999558.1 tetratricopeptide (TPR) repeat protein [Streptomonospora salina]